MNRWLTLKWFLVLAIALPLLGLACSKDSNPEKPADLQPVLSTECVRCHTDQVSLIATAEPDTTEGGGESSGEG